MRHIQLLVAALMLSAGVLLGGLAGCGSDNNTDSSSNDATVTTVTESTATGSSSADQVVAAAADGSFNPAEIYRKVSPGVVTILSIFDGSGNASVAGGAPQGGQGSGFVISKEGEILTNAHVVTSGGEGAAGGSGGGSPIVKAKEVYVDFGDGNRVSADIVGFDPDADVALIKVDPSGLELVPLALSDGKGLAIGQPVAAIGSPFGEEQSLSVGIISATDRAIQSLSNFSIDDAIQTDAAINPGNSGGPLLDADSRVIGINQQIESDSGSNSGVGFAVPITAVRYSLDQLRRSGKVEYAFIGVTTQTVYPQLAAELGVDADSGALISKVEPGSPAEKAGLKGGGDKIRFQAQQVVKGGDLIVALDGKPVDSSSDVARLIADDKPGQTIKLEIVRGSEHSTVDLTLGPRPAGNSG
ncbi:MAG: S1C family serine protease [Solirubrobacterales bacterium]